jgi:hypothetical protein
MYYALIYIFIFVSIPLYSEGFVKNIKPILEKNCYSCHNSKKDKGDINLKSLPYENIDEANAEIWTLALDMINSGEMPPAKKKRLSTKDLNDTTKWIELALKRTKEELKSKEGYSRLRRLNRTEYRNTIRDLIGHSFDATELFTEDTSSHGFDNVSDALQVSPLHIEAYVAAAERVVSKIIDIPKTVPKKQHWKIINETKSGNYMKLFSGPWHDGHLGKPKSEIKKGYLKGNVLPNTEIPNGSTPYRMLDLTTTPATPYAGSWDIRAFGGTHENGGGANFGFKWFAFEEGQYRIKLTVESFGPKGWGHNLRVTKYPEGKIWKGHRLLPGMHNISYEIYRDEIPWYVKVNGNRNWGLNANFYFFKKHPKHKNKHGLHVSSFEIEGPINSIWPPVYYTNIFHKRKEIMSDEEYAKEVLENFMVRAYRQPVIKEQVNRMLSLYKSERTQNTSFNEAMRLPLITVLSSSRFLYLSGPGKNQPKAFSLANRMSYFLWRTMPDETLFKLAANGRLLNPKVRKQQVLRMLKDDKINALVTNFTQQWLELRKIKHLNALHLNLNLKESMVAESEAFFKHILDNELPLKTFLDSDFVMINERMSSIYGIHGIQGEHFRKVMLKPHHKRGGVLGQASVLTVTSNGIRTLPVNRGVFILEQILGDPPSSPPPDVGQLEDVKISKPNATIREKLELHRKDPTCARCHNKIDPLGFALENFDFLGRYRNFEMTHVEGKGHIKGAAVDPSGKLPDGSEFKDLKSFKVILLRKEKEFVRCFIEKMLVYGLDRHVGFRDEAYVESLSDKIIKNGATVSRVIEEIILSKPFAGDAF